MKHFRCPSAPSVGKRIRKRGRDTDTLKRRPKNWPDSWRRELDCLIHKPFSQWEPYPEPEDQEGCVIFMNKVLIIFHVCIDLKHCSVSKEIIHWGISWGISWDVLGYLADVVGCCGGKCPWQSLAVFLLIVVILFSSSLNLTFGADSQHYFSSIFMLTFSSSPPSPLWNPNWCGWEIQHWPPASTRQDPNNISTCSYAGHWSSDL